MDIITKVRTVRNKLTLMGAFSLIGAIAYSNYTNSVMLLFITLFLFADMMDEDAKYTTVDIRKTAALGFFFFLASKEPMLNFILTAIVAFFIFRIIYLIAILRYSRPKNTIETLIDNYTSINPIGLLPSFGLAFFLLGLYLEVSHTKEPTFLLGFQEFLKETTSFLSETTLFWIIFLALWLLLEFIVKRYTEQEDIEIVEGLGMGDVIVLPFFTAFLGITAFLFVLFLGCIIHLLQYLIRYIQISEGAK